MRTIRLVLLLLVTHFGLGCSNIRLAVYDYQKRHEYAEVATTNYLKTDSGKTFSLKHGMVETAHTYIGSPYKYGGMDAKKGFDCSGFVCTVAKKNQVDLPRSSCLMASGAPHISIKKSAPGDLVFFGDHGTVHHVGIIEKNSGHELRVVHSTNQRGVISENVLESDYWNKRILFAVDILSYQKATPSAKISSAGS